MPSAPRISVGLSERGDAQQRPRAPRASLCVRQRASEEALRFGGAPKGGQRLGHFQRGQTVCPLGSGLVAECPAKQWLGICRAVMDAQERSQPHEALDRIRMPGPQLAEPLFVGLAVQGLERRAPRWRLLCRWGEPEETGEQCDQLESRSCPLHH